MKYGYFDDSNKEYVITEPKTPYPWINYLGTEKFFSLISNTSGGYCFYRDARLRRITRYRYNNVPIDMGGRYFYINENGDLWSHSWSPVKKDLSFYECRHGLGYTIIKGERNSLCVTQTSFVPLGYDCEIHNLSLKNTSDKAKNFKLFSFVEFCLWNAQDDSENFQRNFSTGEVEVEDSVIYHKTEYRERRNHYSFFSVNVPVSGYDTDRNTFIGLYNGFDNPQCVANGKSGNSIASGWAPIGSHCIDIELNPNEEKTIIFMLGYVENAEKNKWYAEGIINKDKAKEMIAKFSNEKAVEEALLENKNYWEELLSCYKVKTEDEKLNRMVNIWNQYQCMVTFNMSRSASYFESGIGRGMGFRDSNQDLLGFVHQIPERARERILDIAATQFEDGSAYHQYQPLTKKGNSAIGGGFNDDPLWLISGVSAYLKETGDYSILDEVVPYDCDENNVATLLEHLKASFYHVVNNLGPHGLPLIGRADWNDCLNLNCFSTEPSESFQTCANRDGKTAESVFIAGLFVYAGRDYVEILNKKNMFDEAKIAEDEINKMCETVEKYGYDGEWFLRAYDFFGNKIGSNECEEGKIFIEPQGMCVMAEIGKDSGKALKSLDSVKEHLDTKYGIMLQQPPYKTYHLELGEISSYPPGYKENAGIFCHNNPWIMLAETVMGRGDRAFEVYKKIAPAYLEDICELHRTEPYVYSQMIAGKDAFNFGEAKNSWLTGTASWNFVAISQGILGIIPDFDGLKIDPCIPKKWETFKVIRKFRGTEYEIEVTNPNHVSKGIADIIVDGVKYDSNIIKSLGKKCHVKVIMG